MTLRMVSDKTALRKSLRPSNCSGGIWRFRSLQPPPTAQEKDADDPCACTFATGGEVKLQLRGDLIMRGDSRLKLCRVTPARSENSTFGRAHIQNNSVC